LGRPRGTGAEKVSTERSGFAAVALAGIGLGLLVCVAGCAAMSGIRKTVPGFKA
jgi:ABC-type lipoprotein release transport system permease subunit